jgi:8-oxo-dGTP pyrophosphatase MutT (NUDIX family)
MSINHEFWQTLGHALAESAGASSNLFSDMEQAIGTEQGKYPRRAAVLLLLKDLPSPEVIYTLRAKHLSHHAGEVCFPGGMWEPHDQSLLATALRETHEEIGLHPSLVHILGALPERQTRSGTRVQPFVGRIPADCRFELNHHELDVLFTVPLADFARGLQVRTDLFERNGLRLRMPVYKYEDYEIWGFTAAVTADLLTRLNPLARSPLQSR